MDDLITMRSDFSLLETISRIIEIIEKNNWHIFARIDHAREARNKGLELRPTELILFGNPEIGTLLMQNQQVSAIDLPMKVLVWEDEKSQVNITINDMDWLKERHGLTDNETITKIAEVIENVFMAGSKKQ